MKDRKGLALLISSKIPGKGKESEDETEDKGDDDNEGYVAAFKALRKAIESSDDEAGAEALKDFVDMV